LEGGDDLITLRKAANVQTLFVRRTAAKARIVWRVSFLDTFFVHMFTDVPNPALKAPVYKRFAHAG
jgi:hypothetical protein